jgi:transposase
MRLLKKGLNQSEVARRLGVGHASVNRWAQALAEQGPEALGYETPLWTLGRVGHLIEQEFGVQYHKGHIWKLLRQLRWSCQQPEGRARERNEGAIRHWKRVEWPRIKKKPKKKGARSSSWTRAE